MNTTSTVIDPSQDERRRDLTQWAVDSWGTAIVLDRRVRQYQRIIFYVSIAGFLAPLLVGAVALNLGANLLDGILAKYLIGSILVIQAVASGVVVFAGIDRKLKEAQDSSSINKLHAAQCSELSQNLKLLDPFYQQSFDDLRGTIRTQSSHDEKLVNKQVDRRRAHRAGLIRFSLECGKCGLAPRSESAKADSSTCSSCGDF